MKKMNFKNTDSLKGVRDVLDEADVALKDHSHNIARSKISEALAGALGAGTGGALSFAALFWGGTVTGLSAAGVTSGLAAAGAIVGGGMVAGVFVLAAPVAILGGVAYGITTAHNNKQLKEEKERLYNLAIQKHQAIINELKNKASFSIDRIQYLESINILLKKAISELKEDLGR
jgi:hypothetical protein